MADSYRAQIPFESLDPLTIGASDDESKVYREELELEIPEQNLLAAIYPEEPEPVPSATETARNALASPTSGPAFSELLNGAGSVAVIIDNQFRPTPASKLLPPVFDAIEAAGVEACVITANGKVFPLSESDIEQKVGRENLDRVEPLQLRAVSADALRGAGRPDALRHRRDRDDGRPRRDHERTARHTRPRDRAQLRPAPELASPCDRAFQRDLRVRESGAGEGPGRHRDLRSVRPDRSPFLPHGLGLHVGGCRAEGRRHAHLLQSVPRSPYGGRRFSGSRADGSDEAVHAADRRELPADPA